MQWQDFDLDGKVKVPAGYYLVLVFLLRSYVLWVISLTYGEDRSLLLATFYPSPSLFMLALLVGVPALFNFTLFTFKTYRQSPIFQKLWRHQHFILLLALLIDLSLQLVSLFKANLQIERSAMLVLFINFYLCWYWMSSAKVKRFFHNWLI